MKERMSSTAWSEVTPSVDAPKPPEGTPPRSGGSRMEEGWEILHTPNGTRVPSGPPPPEMPPWPFHYYEKEERMADCVKWLGPWEEEGLRDQIYMIKYVAAGMIPGMDYLTAGGIPG